MDKKISLIFPEKELQAALSQTGGLN